MIALGMKRNPLNLRAISAVLLLAAVCHSDSPVSVVPDFTLPAVRGGTFHLRAQPSQPVLLAFLQTVPDTADTPSRSQVVFVASMAQQYGPRGLRVVAVDASALALGSPPSRDAILNASYDWQLKIQLLVDRNSRIARQLGIKELPTVLLIAADGTIMHRWQGLTRPAVLAQSIEKLVGGPLGRVP
jgi:peroxiredoxin